MQCCRDKISIEPTGKLEVSAPKGKENILLLIFSVVILLALLGAMFYYYKGTRGKKAGVEEFKASRLPFVAGKKSKSHLEMEFEGLCCKVEDAIRHKDMLNARELYTRLSSLYGMI